MPPKRSVRVKVGRQEPDMEPEQEMSRPPAPESTKTEGGTKEKVEAELPSGVVRPSVKEMTKDELWDEYFVFQDQLQVLRKEKNHLKFEIALKSSGNAQRCLHSTKAKLREKLWLKQEAEKCHRAKMEEYQKKVAQLEMSHHDEACELKMDAMAKTSKAHLEEVKTEDEIQRKIHVLQSEMREKGAIAEICWNLKQKHQDRLRELRMNVEEQHRELEARYIHDIRIMYKHYKKKSKIALDEMDKSGEKNAASTIKENQFFLKNVSNCLSDLNRYRKEKMELEGCLERLKKTERWMDREIAAAEEERKVLTKDLQESEQKDSETELELVVQRAAMAKRVKASTERTQRILEESRDLYVKNHQLQLKYEQAQQKNEELQRKEDVLREQQRSSLKAMVLEKQIKTLTEALEKQQLILWVVLAFGLGDPTAGKNMKEVFTSKHATIKALRDETCADLMEYEQLLKTATAVDPSVDQGLSQWHRYMEKSLRKDSDDVQKLDDFMQELEDFCTSENNCTHR